MVTYRGLKSKGAVNITADIFWPPAFPEHGTPATQGINRVLTCIFHRVHV
jgi:hypothetical protein